MSWFVKNAVSGILLFPCNLLLIQLAAWPLRKRRPFLSSALALGGLAGLILLSSSGVALPLVESVEMRIPALHIDEPGLASQADAIVILGAGRIVDAEEYRHDVVSPNGLLRLRYGVDIQHRTGKRILLTGGSPDGPGKSEAALMNDALKDSFGLQAQWLEEKSVNTAQNAQFSYRILQPLGIRRIFLVTHAAHMARAQRAFEKAGFQVVPAPMGFYSDNGGEGSILAWIPSAKGVEMSFVFFHEVIGSFWYAITGAS